MKAPGEWAASVAGWVDVLADMGGTCGEPVELAPGHVVLGASAVNLMRCVRTHGHDGEHVVYVPVAGGHVEAAGCRLPVHNRARVSWVSA